LALTGHLIGCNFHAARVAGRNVRAASAAGPQRNDGRGFRRPRASGYVLAT